MVYPLTITGSDMRDINRSAILEIIRRESPISRTIIADRLNISLSTVMRIVDDLVDEGFVRHQGNTEWSGGRRRPLLEFNSDGYLVLGVDLGGMKLYGALTDLGGNIVDELDLNRHGASAEDNYTDLVRLIETLLASPRLQDRRVRGIGVGAPGITLHREGIVTWAYSLNWKDFPLKARLSEQFKLPTTVDNDVNLAALGELWFGAGQTAQNMVLITIGTGIGAGIIINRTLYRGSREASGEIGHMIPGKEFLGQRYLEYGALERMASDTGITERACRLLKARHSPIDIETLLADDVFDAARQGKKWAQAVIDETVDFLSIAVGNLAVSFDPDLIVLGGGVTRFADLLVEPIQKRIQGVIPTPPNLVVSRLGRRATAMGAITNVLHNTSNFFVVRKLS